MKALLNNGIAGGPDRRFGEARRIAELYDCPNVDFGTWDVESRYGITKKMTNF
jgi:hypothetical protein